MLQLDRCPGEVIIMTLPSGKVIRLKVLSFKGRAVQFGIEAPREIPILRSELINTSPKETTP